MSENTLRRALNKIFPLLMVCFEEFVAFGNKNLWKLCKRIEMGFCGQFLEKWILRTINPMLFYEWPEEEQRRATARHWGHWDQWTDKSNPSDQPWLNGRSQQSAVNESNSMPSYNWIKWIWNLYKTYEPFRDTVYGPKTNTSASVASEDMNVVFARHSLDCFWPNNGFRFRLQVMKTWMNRSANVRLKAVVWPQLSLC